MTAGRQHDYRDCRGLGVLAKFHSHVKSAHARHLIIGDDQLRSVLQRQPQRFLAVVSHQHADVGPAEFHRQHVRHMRLVIGNKYRGMVSHLLQSLAVDGYHRHRNPLA